MADIKTTLDNIVSHWSLEETTGDRLDQTANNNDLYETNSVTYVAGKQGNAAYFDVANTEYLTIDAVDQTNMSITGDLSFSAWIYLDSLPASGAEMWIANKYYGSAPRTGYGFGVANRSGSYKLHFRCATAAGGYAAADSSGSGLTTGTWYHVVATLDVSTSQVQFYVNGADWGNISLSTATGGSIAAGSNEFKIGGQATVTSECFDGAIDEVTLTSDIITSGEVATIYNSGSGIPYDAGGGGYTGNIKSIAGVAQANIKSIAGVANASIKSVVGVTNS